MLRGDVETPAAMPDFSIFSQPSIPAITSPIYGDTVHESVSITWTPSIHTSGIDHYELELNQQVFICNDNSYSVNFSEGNYEVRVRAKNVLGNYGGWSEKLVFDMKQKATISTIKDQNDLGISVYPNPINDAVHVKIGALDPKDFSLLVFDSAGKFIGSYRLTKTLTDIPFYNMPKGTYLLKINHDNREYKTFEIVKNK